VPVQADQAVAAVVVVVLEVPVELA